jgi:hypothetical protein
MREYYSRSTRSRVSSYKIKKYDIIVIKVIGIAFGKGEKDEVPIYTA